MSNLIECDLAEFTDKVASGDPTPGGGSFAAYAAAGGASLMLMYCRLTVGRKKYADAEQKMQDAIKELERARGWLLDLVDIDSAAYLDVMAVRGMPQENDEEKRIRLEAVDAANIKAAKAPLETATWAVRILEVAKVIHKDGNPNGLTDLGVGVQMAMAGFSGAAMNVYVNLAQIKDEEFISAARKTVHDLETKGRQFSTAIAAYVFAALEIDG